MKRIFIAVLSISLLLSSCSLNRDQKEVLKPEDFTYMKIELVNGERWQTNEDTRQSIVNMLDIVRNFDGDYIGLNKSLEKEFQELFRKCTMTGEAHNQLHNYLFPLVEFFDALKEDESKAKDTLPKLEKHLRAFNLYFI